MGCGSSLNQVHDVQLPQEPHSSNTFQNAFIPQLQLNSTKCFLFGQTDTHRKIILLDGQHSKFSAISSKFRIPTPPIKYQPFQIVYEQSQQLFSSNLFNNNFQPPYNYMFATFIDYQSIFLCGGIDYNEQSISSQSYIYHTFTKANQHTNNNKTQIIVNKFDKLGFMNKNRYSHMGIFYRIGKLKYIFIFGGKTKNQQAISQCQKYSFQEKKWMDICPMNIKRSTGCCLVFRNKIYVFGGFTANAKRSKKIEVYDPIKDYWEILNVKLHRGFQAAIIFSPNPNEVLVIGGCVQRGSLKSCIRVNLAQETYVWDSDMLSERFLHKGIKDHDNIYVFGGDFKDSMERYSIKDSKWHQHHISYQEYINCEEIHKFTYSAESVHVQFEQQSIHQEHSLQQNKKILFGCDSYPVIIEIDLDKWSISKVPVPMMMRLRSYMCVTQMQNGKYFLAGGVDELFEKASRSCYIYYSLNNKAIELPKMNQRRYKSAIVHFNKSIYVFGGMGSQTEILRSCQRYDESDQKWYQLPNLAQQRVNPKTIIIKNNIYIIGGKDSLESVYDIEIFNTQIQHLSTYSAMIPFSCSIISCFEPKYMSESQSEVLILGRNQILNEDIMNVLVLCEQQHLNKEDGLKCEELPLVINPYQIIHTFQFLNKFYFISSKYILEWSGKIQNKIQQKKINNLEIFLQLPLEKFSLG